jgi:hypothetical protein
MNSAVDRPPDPTKLSPVAEQRFWLYGELAKALPGATKEEILLLQEQLQARLQARMVETVEVTVEHVRAAPEETLERLRRGQPALRE